AVAALGAGALTAFVGLVVPGLRALYDDAWFVGFGVAGMLYYVTMTGTERFSLGRVPLESRER
ncbi:MAG TPA: nitrate reductase, partial [Vicinamibacteria bacterium]